MGQQNHWRYLVSLVVPYKQRGGKELFGKLQKGQVIKRTFQHVDWEHLELALKNKMDMYRIWWSKQNSDFCNTRVQVSCYSSDLFPYKQCLNCGRCKTAAHLMFCPDDNRTRLLVENVDELTTWMSQDNRMDPEILYWIPKYILMRGNKLLSEMVFMSPQFKALAKSQDLI